VRSSMPSRAAHLQRALPQAKHEAELVGNLLARAPHLRLHFLVLTAARMHKPPICDATAITGGRPQLRRTQSRQTQPCVTLLVRMVVKTPYQRSRRIAGAIPGRAPVRPATLPPTRTSLIAFRQLVSLKNLGASVT